MRDCQHRLEFVQFWYITNTYSNWIGFPCYQTIAASYIHTLVLLYTHNKLQNTTKEASQQAQRAPLYVDVNMLNTSYSGKNC